MTDPADHSNVAGKRAVARALGHREPRWYVSEDDVDAAAERAPGVDYYWEYEPPPDPDRHRPAFGAEATWYQVYETVTEGTPVTPPFETLAELVDWLVEKGEAHGTDHERR